MSGPSSSLPHTRAAHSKVVHSEKRSTTTNDHVKRHDKVMGTPLDHDEARRTNFGGRIKFYHKNLRQGYLRNFWEDGTNRCCTSEEKKGEGLGGSGGVNGDGDSLVVLAFYPIFAAARVVLACSPLGSSSCSWRTT